MRLLQNFSGTVGSPLNVSSSATGKHRKAKDSKESKGILHVKNELNGLELVNFALADRDVAEPLLPIIRKANKLYSWSVTVERR